MLPDLVSRLPFAAHRLITFGRVDVEGEALPRAGRHDPDQYHVRPTRQVKIYDELFCPYSKADAESVFLRSTGSRSYPLPNQKPIY